MICSLSIENKRTQRLIHIQPIFRRETFPLCIKGSIVGWCSNEHLTRWCMPLLQTLLKALLRDLFLFLCRARMRMLFLLIKFTITCLRTITSGSFVIFLYKTLALDHSQSKSTPYPLLLAVLKTQRRESYRAKYYLAGRIFRCFLCSDGAAFIILMLSLNHFRANDRLIWYLIAKRSAFSRLSISLMISALKEVEYCLLFSCPLCWEVESFSCSWLVRSIIPASVCLFSPTLLTATEATSLMTDFTTDSIAGSCLINFCLSPASAFQNATGDYN